VCLLLSRGAACGTIELCKEVIRPRHGLSPDHPGLRPPSFARRGRLQRRVSPPCKGGVAEGRGGRDCKPCRGLITSSQNPGVHRPTTPPTLDAERFERRSCGLFTACAFVSRRAALNTS